MNMKQLLLAAYCILFFSSVYAQSGNTGEQYRKYYLSINVGPTFGVGSSSTAITEMLSLPATNRGFSPGFDGAWFFSKKWGIGLKYGFYQSGYDKESYQEYTDHSYDYLVYEYRSLTFKEESHMFGPAIYARLPLGETRWMIMANAGVVMFHNKLSEIEREIYHIRHSTDLIEPDKITDAGDPSVLMQLRDGGPTHTGVTAGFALSAAIRYQLLPFAGISIQVNGVYASLSKMRYYSPMTYQYETGDFSRKIGRMGLSAAIDFCF